MGNLTKEEQAQVEELLAELTSTGDIAGYNAPLFFTSQQEDIMKNLKAKNNNLRDDGTPSKEKVEQALGSDMGGSQWLKAKPVGENPQVIEKSGRNILKEENWNDDWEDTSEETKNPFPLSRYPKHDPELDEDEENGTVQLIPISKLRTSQLTLKKTGLDRYISLYKQSEPPRTIDIPLVYKEKDGTYTILDGNHKLAAQYFLKKQFVKALVISRQINESLLQEANLSIEPYTMTLPEFKKYTDLHGIYRANQSPNFGEAFGYYRPIGKAGVHIENSIYSGQMSAVMYRNEEGKPIGMLQFGKKKSNKLQIQTIYVLPEYRRHGIGNKMVEVLKQKYPNITFSNDLSEDGLNFVYWNSVKDAMRNGKKLPEKVLNQFTNMVRESILQEADPEQAPAEPQADSSVEPAPDADNANQSNQPTDNGDIQQQPKDVPQNDKLNVIYSLEQHDLALLYNQIFVPYFQFWKNKFSVTETDKCLPIFLLYIHCDTRLKAIHRDEVEAKHLYVYTQLKEANASIVPAIKDIFASLNLNTVQPNVTADQVHQLLVKNMSAVMRSLHRALLPVANGYLQALGTVDNPALKQLFQAANTTNVVATTTKIIIDDQKRFLLSRLSVASKGMNGDYLISRIQGAIAGFNPQLSISTEGKIDNTQFNLVRENPAVKTFSEQYKQVFNLMLNSLTKYNQLFQTFVQGLKPEMFVQNHQVNKAVIAHVLREKSNGLLNRINDTSMDEISEKVKEFMHTMAAKMKTDSEAEANRPPTNNPIKNFLLVNAEMKNDNLKSEELDFLTDVVKNLRNVKIEDDKLQGAIGQQRDPKAIRPIMLQTVRGQGSLVDFIQDWFAIAHKFECVLYASNKLDFEDFLNKATNDSFDESFNDEDKKGQVPSLVATLGENKLHGLVNGHQLQWNPNRGVQSILGDIASNGLVKDLLNQPQDFWNALIFTDEFKKNKLFTDGEINNQDDIEQAEAALRGQRGFQGTQEFVPLIRQHFEKENVKGQWLNGRGVSTFSDLLHSFADHPLPDNSKAIQEIGKSIVSGMFDFVNRYADQLRYRRDAEGISDSMARFFASNILTSVGGKEKRVVSSQDIQTLQKRLMQLFNVYGNNEQQGKVKNQAEMNQIIEQVLHYLNQIRRG